MKVFVIGGHKNGTFSIHNWFLDRGLKSIHAKYWIKDDKLIEENECFGDQFAEYGLTHKIIELNEKYPEAKFILNYRPLRDYMNSLLKHLLNGHHNNDFWKWLSDFSERIINTHKVNYFAVNYFKNKNILDKLLVINVCNGENEKNTRILEKFLDLPPKKDIILKRMTHNLLPISHPEIQKYYEIYKDDIEDEINKVKEELTEEEYLGFLKLLPKNHKFF